MEVIHTPQTPFQAVLSNFDTSARMLAASALNQPYSFFLIAPLLRPAMVESSGQWGKILAECKSQYDKHGQFTPRSVSSAIGADLSALALEGAEMELRFSFDLFFEQWGRAVEVGIYDHYTRWLSEGHTSDEISALSHNARRDAGLFRDGMESDGEREFEHDITIATGCPSSESISYLDAAIPVPCYADFNEDEVLDFFDYLDFVSAFSSGSLLADFNSDQIVDFFDYLDFVLEFANGC